MATAIFEEGAREQCAQSEVIRANYPKITDRLPKKLLPSEGSPREGPRHTLLSCTMEDPAEIFTNSRAFHLEIYNKLNNSYTERKR